MSSAVLPGPEASVSHPQSPQQQGTVHVASGGPGHEGPDAVRAWTRFWRLVRRIPMLTLVGLIRAYQSVISPMTGPTCKYYPSCSQYALVAVRRHGALRGIRLAVWRILRCNPWSLGGVDDVPEVREQHNH